MKRNSVFCLLLAMLFSSCFTAGTLDVLNIEVMEPAVITFPDAVKRVGVIDRQNTKASKQDPISYDSFVLAEELAYTLFDGEYFDDVILSDSAVLLDRDDEKIYPLTQEHVADLCDDLGVDMILALEYTTARYIDTQAPGWKPDFKNDKYADNITAEAQVTTLARLYVPQRSSALRNLVVSDTLVFEGTPNGFFNFMKPVEHSTVRKSVIEFQAQSLTEKMVPHWREAGRWYFYNGSANMRDGALFASKNEWEKAAKCWQDEVNQSKKPLQTLRAKYNLALASEMQGDVAKAIELINEVEEGLKAKPNEEMRSAIFMYKMLLEKRNTQVQSLNLQMHRFDNK